MSDTDNIVTASDVLDSVTRTADALQNAQETLVAEITEALSELENHNNDPNAHGGNAGGGGGGSSISLSDSTNSNSSITAASSKAVKTAYDTAISALGKAEQALINNGADDDKSNVIVLSEDYHITADTPTPLLLFPSKEGLKVYLPDGSTVSEYQIANIGSNSIAIVDSSGTAIDDGPAAIGSSSACTVVNSSGSWVSAEEDYDTVVKNGITVNKGSVSNLPFFHSPPNTRNDIISAQTDYIVPEYVVGKNRLIVELDGVRCVEGDDIETASYVEVGSEGDVSDTIQWHQDIDVEYDIIISVIT